MLLSEPRISIVIPVYNGSDYLRDAINSALVQDYDNFEVIVVNDGSNDCGATEAIALSFGDRIHYFSKENGGVATALNLAIKKMSGDYFSWLSHDDLYAPDKLSRQVQALARSGRDDLVIYSDYSVFTDVPAHAVPVELEGVPPRNFRYWITVENRLHGCTLLIPRKAFEIAGFFDPALKTTQDYDLWFRMAKFFDFVHMPCVTVMARSHANQGSIRMSDVALVECNNLLSAFVGGLSKDEIVQAGNATASEGYRVIAKAMFSRGFNEAGKLAEIFSVSQNSGVANKAKKIFFTFKRYMSQMLNGALFRMFARRILSPRLRRFLRNFFPSPSVPQDRSDLQGKFTDIYENNTFGGRISRSGEGSDLVQTAEVRRCLPELVEDLKIESFLDAPCGDWCWMREVQLGVKKYIGVDIVDPLIQSNLKNFAAPGVHFECLNLAEDRLPKVDLIFSRDCLVHLSFDDALRIIKNFKESGSEYLLTTTFVSRESNNDLVGKDSFWRPLNMQLPPFNFPAPLRLIDEKCSEEGGLFADKSLAFWRLADIRI